MQIEVRRRKLLHDGLALSFGAGLLGFAFLALPIAFFLVNFVDPDESTLYLTMGAAVGVPAALGFGWHAWKSVNLDPRAACGVCKQMLKDCVCCSACEGTGETPLASKLGNWLMPASCILCIGTGDERPDKRDPAGCMRGAIADYCCKCGNKQFGKFVGVVETMLIVNSIGPPVFHSETTKLAERDVFLCADCGKGAKNEAEAEDAAARALSVGIDPATTSYQERRSRQDQLKTHDAATGFWGVTAWRKAPKKQA